VFDFDNGRSVENNMGDFALTEEKFEFCLNIGYGRHIHTIKKAVLCLFSAAFIYADGL
jgi:hypothetical protein